MSRRSTGRSPSRSPQSGSRGCWPRRASRWRPSSRPARSTVSRAGSVTHFEGETLVENIHRFLAGKPVQGSFDGHANCFIETGFHKALLIDFNYDVEPLPGRYPEPHVGPLPLLEQSRLNHIAKLMFQWIYWHVLLPGHDV